jgi:hypothetical protein
MFKPEAWNIPGQRRAVRTTLIISILIWLPAAIIMGRNMIIYNFLGA